jgi:multisubunit Na+/H+ antiporter MnhE subunit
MIATAVYALALASLNPWDIALGALLGLVVLTIFRDFLFPQPDSAGITWLRKVLGVPALIVATFIEIVKGTIHVASVVLSPARSWRAGFVDIPIGERSPSGVMVNGLLNTLSPGSVFIDVDPPAGTWRIHAIDATDPDQVRADVQRLYESYQWPVWP